MDFSAATLLGVLEAHTPRAATGFVVALSGGEDSACLLTALVQPGSRPFRDLPVRAIHVDHGLSPAAADFQRACEELCRSLAVPLTVVAICVDSGRGTSIERMGLPPPRWGGFRFCPSSGSRSDGVSPSRYYAPG